MSIKKLAALMVILLFACVAAANGDTGTKVVATVGDEKITQADIDEFTQNIPRPFRRAFANKALEKVIDAKVFYQMAIEEGLNKTPGFAARIESEKRRILADYFIEKKIKDKIKVSTKEVENYYKEHKADFVQKERVRPAHILLKTRKEAEVMKTRLAKGEPFEKLARENTGNPLAKAGGDMGWKGRGQMPKEFENAAFRLQIGEISGIIKSSMGFHIVKVLDKKPGGMKSLDESRAQIENKLKTMKMISLKKRYREKARVRIIDESYKGAFR